MELSVIIVNFNVKYFLEQCLFSCRKALSGIEGEIIIIDNNSVDGSTLMIAEKFPEHKLIENNKNTGFSKAVNQGINKASGKYILLLNPDTVVEEDTFRKCINFMGAHHDAGALGVKMIDGKGKFLPESKRSLPKPSVAFYKIFGLSKLFPKSRIFGSYNLGYLSPDEIHEVDILPGAFMFLRKKVLDQVGLMDEDFFMYGEDVDLSYRIIQAGYKNFYYPETTIIHYKGESTKKGSLNYVIMFYKAMLIFANKHFSKRKIRIFSLFIGLAIYFRAVLSIVRRIFEKVLLPILDIVIIFLGFIFITPLWENIKLVAGSKYPPEFLHYVVPGYIIIWVLSSYINGGYDKPYRLLRHIAGILIGTLIILIIYGLLPLQLRFSRALIFIGATWAILSTPIIRLVLNRLNQKYFQVYRREGKKILIIGDEDENKRISSLINQSGLKPKLLAFIAPYGSKLNSTYIGTYDQLEEIVTVNKIDEIIFCAKNIPATEIITKMIEISGSQVEFKIAPSSSISIIGSNSTHTVGDPYLIEVDGISTPKNKRLKRLFDIVTAILFLIIFPFLIFFIKNPIGLLRNIFRVIFGIKSWVGYKMSDHVNDKFFPSIKPGILTPRDGYNAIDPSPETLESVNLTYANNYKIYNDISIIYRSYKFLGREEKLND